MATMAKALTIALDAMGGDAAPQMVVRGAAIALERFPDVRFLMVGRESEVAPLLGSKKRLLAASDLRHTDDVVSSDAKPSVALRAGRNSSMRRSEEHTSELKSLMRISYAVFCLKKK